ncbi:MAG: hypothetical protein ACXVRG_02490 [Gaiellaceae bacterium]
MIVATLAILVLATSLSLALASGFHRSGPDKRAVILAALKSSGWKSVFPSHEAKRDCWIAGGGPAPGTRFEATCRTRVRLHGDGSATVLFTHWIGGDPHTWVYAVSRSLRVRFVRDFGPGIAPEGWA